MPRWQHRARSMVGIVLLVVLSGALAACAPSGVTAGATTSGAASPRPTGAATSASIGSPEAATGAPQADGVDDPGQSTRRSGPIAQYGGPPYGLQGAVEQIGDGLWCATVGLFWEGEAPPQNVTFTIEGIASSPDGALTSGTENCGSGGAVVSCIGFTMSPDTPFTLCSVALAATDTFAGVAEATFVGTLECTEPTFCDAAQARAASAGPAIIITAPPAPGSDEEG